MSTLVKYLLALVLYHFNGGEVQENATAATTPEVVTVHTIEELNPEYIITREEVAFKDENSAIYWLTQAVSHRKPNC